MAKAKRPCYVVQKGTGVWVPNEETEELEEAVIIFGIRQTKESADRLSARQVGSEVVKMFVVSE